MDADVSAPFFRCAENIHKQERGAFLVTTKVVGYVRRWRLYACDMYLWRRLDWGNFKS